MPVVYSIQNNGTKNIKAGWKKMKVRIRGFGVVVLLWACFMSAFAQDPVMHDEVVQELQRFRSAWSEPVPCDDPQYGIIHILSLLNLDFQGLEKVKAAAEAGQYDAARQELLNYFKTTRTDYSAEPGSYIRGKSKQWVADNALRHYFQGNRDAHPPVYRGGKIDWVGRAFADGKEIHDVEWYHQFHRLCWWPSLAWTYTQTGDERYFFEWQYEMVNWAKSNLPFSSETPKFIPTGMNTYFRCEQLTKALPHMLRSENFDSKTLLYFLGSFYEQAEHIRTVYASKGNHLLGELSRVFLNGVNFPEFKKSQDWINDAVTRLPRMMMEDVYSDGMNKELVFSYHTMYLSLFSEAYTMFRERGYEDSLPKEYYSRLLKMAEIYAMQEFPDHTICQFGDAWKHRDPAVAFRSCLTPFAEDIPYFDYVVSDGEQGRPPAKCSAVYPESGFYFFRSAWVPDAVFMPVKCSRGAEWGHNQIDNGTFELFAYGRNLMTDSGSYMYGSSSAEDRRWREWFRSTKVHQTLTLDNRNTERKPHHILWSETTNLVAAVFENESYPGLTHRRSILFVDKRWFLIYDEAIGTDTGDVGIHFQFAPCEYMLDGLSARTAWPQGANLLVKTFPQGKKVSLEKEEGWISYDPQVKEPRPAWCWKVSKQERDPQVTFLTALVPYREGEAPETVDASVSVSGDIRTFNLKVDQAVRQVELDMNQKTAILKPM